MKHLILGLVALVVLSTSCVSKSEHDKQLNATRDSLNSVIGGKEGEIVQFLAGFNEIQQNLDSIKAIEKIVSVNSTDKELTASAKDNIISDIQHLHSLLEKNKALVAQLKKMQSGDLKKIKELQQTVALLQKQIETKDAEIAELNNKVASLNIDVANLTGTVSNLTAENQMKDQTITAKENQLNKGWYAYGSEKEMIKNNIIEKTGGVIGLGKTMKITEKINKSFFEEIDIRNVKSITLNVKKAKLISAHPEGSFHFTGDTKKVNTLEIDDAAQFWSVSKYLVIVVE